MKVLVLNPGSTSLRFDVIELEGQDARPAWGQKRFGGMIQGIGKTATLTLIKAGQTQDQGEVLAPDYSAAAQQALHCLTEQGWIDSIDAVGHRVVHGGDFERPATIDPAVLKQIEELSDRAPLHNPPAVETIRAAQQAIDTVPQVAVFDTAFHRTLPDVARYYALPWELTQRYQIQRYGFHGSSHQYLATRYAQIAEIPLDSATLITLHLESGCSMTAIQNGRSVDTSMGFTPLEGLMMGTRCGDLDPALVGYLARKEGVDVGQIEDQLNRKSGLLGVSQSGYDTRELVPLADEQPQVKLALDLFCYRIRKYIGAYLTVLDQPQAIVFGGGIGENTASVRAQICQGLSGCGLCLDPEQNQQVIDREGRISTADSPVKGYVIPVEEALMITQQVVQCLSCA